MTMKYIALEATVEFPFSVNAPATGGVSDADAAPPCDVRLHGAAVNAAPVYSFTADLLSHGDYPAGQYAAIVAATDANGFAADSLYTVYCSAAVTTTTGAVIGEFTTSALLTSTTVQAAVDAALVAYDSASGVTSNTDLEARSIVTATIPTKTDVSDGTATVIADALKNTQVQCRSDAQNSIDQANKITAVNTDEDTGVTGTYDPATDALEATQDDINALFTTALIESYAADGVAPTPAQALFLMQQLLSEFGISGETLTVKKLDGSTTAATLTLSDATNPTGATRTT